MSSKCVLCFFVLLFIATSLESCQKSDEDANLQKVKTVKIDPEKGERGDFLALCDTAYFEPLAIADSVAFGTVTSLKRAGNFTCLSSLNTNSLICFEGSKMLYHLSKIGGGMGEYLSLHAFAIDVVQNELMVYDRQQFKVCYYDLKTANFKREMKINGWFSNIEFIDNQTQVTTVDYGEEKYLSISDRTFKNEGGALETKYPLITDAVFPSSFSHVKNILYYVEPFTETVYQIANREVKPYLHFDFGAFTFPNKNWKNANTELVEQELSKAPYAFMVHLFAKQDDFITFFHYFTPKAFRLVQYDVKSGQITQYKNVSEELTEDNIPLPTAVYQNMYLKVVYPDEFEQTVNTTEWKGMRPLLTVSKTLPSKTIWLLNYRFAK